MFFIYFYDIFDMTRGRLIEYPRGPLGLRGLQFEKRWAAAYPDIITKYFRWFSSRLVYFTQLLRFRLLACSQVPFTICDGGICIRRWVVAEGSHDATMPRHSFYGPWSPHPPLINFLFALASHVWCLDGKYWKSCYNCFGSSASEINPIWRCGYFAINLRLICLYVNECSGISGTVCR